MNKEADTTLSQKRRIDQLEQRLNALERAERLATTDGLRTKFMRKLTSLRKVFGAKVDKKEINAHSSTPDAYYNNFWKIDRKDLLKSLDRVVNLREVKAVKNGEITPGGILDIVRTNVDAGNVKSLFYVTIGNDGAITAGWSTTEKAELVGMDEIGKALVVQDIFEE